MNYLVTTYFNINIIIIFEKKNEDIKIFLLEHVLF